MNVAVNINDDVTNGAEELISHEMPYKATVRVRGVADLLMHRWNPESVEEKSKASKNSAKKKTDDLESYVYRDGKGFLCIPGDYLCGAICHAAKSKTDPRSPRKSASDLFKAAIVPITPLASLGTKKWDYEDRRRVLVQRQGINRVRPAMRAGYELDFDLMVTLPEYVDRDFLYEVVSLAGRVGGLGDFRPTYGRFSIVNFKVSNVI